jgi:hypothetical protein
MYFGVALPVMPVPGIHGAIGDSAPLPRGASGSLPNDAANVSPAPSVVVASAHGSSASASRAGSTSRGARSSASWPSTTAALGAAGGSYDTSGKAARVARAVAFRRLPATDASNSPHDGQDNLPYGTSAAQLPQTIDCAVIRHLVCISDPPRGSKGGSR